MRVLPSAGWCSSQGIGMVEKFLQTLELPVARLESLSTSGFRTSGSPEVGDGAPVYPSILAFGDFLGQNMSRVTAAGVKFGGKALEVTKILEEALGFLKELFIKVKQTQVELHPSGDKMKL